MSKKGFTYTLKIDAEIQDLVAKTKQVKESMQSIMDAGKAPGAEKIFGSIEKAIDKLQSKASKPIESLASFESLQKDAMDVSASLSKLGNLIENLGKMSTADKIDLLPPDLKKQVEGVSAALNNFAKVQGQASQKSQELVEAEKDLASAQKELKRVEGRVNEKKALIEAQKQLVDGAHAEAAAIKEKLEALKKYQTTAAAYEEAGGDKRKAGGGKAELEGMNLPADRRAATKLVPDLDLGNAQAVADTISRLGEEYVQAKKNITDVESTQRKYTNQLSEASTAATVASAKVNDLEGNVQKLNKEFEQNKAKNVQTAYTQLRNEANRLGVDLTNIPVEYTEEAFNQLNGAMNQLVANGMASVDQGLHNTQATMAEVDQAARKLGGGLSVAGTEVTRLDEAVSNTTAFTERIKQFVGLAGGIEIARRAMTNAFSTIKELDAAMTEMAVVTELDVGDYWDQLPEYTARANALGVSIKSAYESATLFYQQGLKTNEVVAMSNETLKMARIAGLSAEDATNKMTAALRGFNMELNETSAQRVSDVYSELAAITASDVKEISSAMTKTASIAASAGMEFETTAAFLSQIIETTRESAETAGTAMKTVIARFQELKKDPSEIGEVDGEIVDANKIETALRSVGVSLRDAKGQFRELDDVFLELSSKWDGLDTNTQRYIATIAAGSRQQSRFIAMMSDYGRTQELVSAANSSAGASNKQFEKTMDSLQSKLNELKNAWDSFTMGIMDSDVVKAGVDILTSILTAINNITDAFGNFSGAAKIGLLVAALYLGDKALKVFMISIKQGAGLFGSLDAAATGTFRSVGQDINGLKKKFDDFIVKTQLARERMQNLATPQQRSAIDAYTNAITRQTKAQSMLQALEKQGVASGSEYALAKAMQTQSTLDLDLATIRLQRSFNLNDNEMKEANALVTAGISLDKAAILVKNEKAMAILREKGALDNLNDEASKNLVLEQADNLLSGTDKVDGFTNSLEELGKKMQGFDMKMWFSSMGTGLKSVGKGFLSAAKSVLSFLGSIWPLLILLALLTAAIALLVFYIKHLNKTSPEGKLKSAKQAAEAAGEAADAAAESYSNLKDSLDSLDDKYKGLEELTKGTKEWKEAVRAINDEVLDLITEYPELAGMFENDVDGVLTIKADMQDDVDAVLKEKEMQVAKTSSAELAAKMAVMKAEDDVAYKNLSKGAKYGNQDAQNALLWSAVGAGALAGAGGGAAGGAALGTVAPGLGNAVGAVVGGIIGGLAGGISAGVGAHAAVSAAQADTKKSDQEYTEAIAMAMAKGKIENPADQEQLSQWIQENLGIVPDVANKMAKELSQNTEELIEFGRALNETEEQSKVFYEAMAMNAVQMVDTSQMSAEAQKQIEVGATAGYMETFEAQAADEIESTMDNMDKWKKKDYITAEAKELYGTDEIEVDNDGNVTIGSGDEAKTVTAEQFKAQLAVAKATENAADALEQLPKTINKISAQMSSEVGKAFKAMYSGKEASAMTNADIDAAKEVTEEQMRAIWGTLSLEEQSAYGDFSTFWKQFSDSQDIAIKAQSKAAEASADAGIDVMDDITMEAAQGYAEQMRQIYLLNTDNAKTLDASIRQVMSTLNETEKSSFIMALNALDWNKVESLETLPETLEQLGLSIDATDLVGQITEFANAVRTIDLTKLNEALPALSKMSKDISSGEQGRTFSKESYEALVQMAPELAKNFQMDQDGQYVYLGSAMSDLTDAIRQNTQALLAEANEQLANKIKMAQVTQQQSVKQNGIEISFAQLAAGQGSEETMRNALQDYQTNMAANNAKIIGIDKFSNDVDVAKLPIDEMKTIFQQLTESASKLPEYMEDYNNNLGQSASLIYQGQNAATNAYGVKMGSTYKQSTSQQQQEFDARSATLMVQAASSGISSALIDKYAAKVAEYKASNDSGLYKEVLSVQNELANATSYNNMRKGLQGVLETSKEVVDEYAKLASGDVVGKINVANQALARFGIQVTNAADADMYMGLLEQLTQGNSNALNVLVQAAQDQAGQAISGMSNAYSQGWGKNLSEEQIEFLNTMEAAQLGYWKKLEDRSTSFVWTTVEELDSIAEAAGTAIEKWENPYTWLYNYNEEINRLIREREKAERSYNKALESETATAETLINLSKQQLKTLQEEVAIQAQSVANAEKEIAKQFSENVDFSKYIQYDINTGGIVIDYASLDASGFNEDKMDDFEKFVSIIEENRDVIVDAEKRIEEIEDETQEINNRGKDEASDTLNVIKEGLIQSRQQEIDSLQTINDSIQEAQNALVDQIQKQIDEARQARENEKTETEIADKETRLAYLMRDTSGGNAMEIAALQKEIADTKEGYTDSLVDQQLQALQDANKKAAEQRQQQIDIAQAQLEAYSNSSQVWIDTKSILDKSLVEAKASGNFNENWMNTQAGHLSGISQGIDSLNPIEKDELMKELTTDAKLAEVFTTKGIADEAENTTNAVNDAKAAINTIKDNAGNFGRFGATDLATGLGSITTELKTKPAEIASSITNAGKYTNLTTAMKNSIFNSPIDTRVVKDTEGEGGGVDEEAEKARKQREAVQRAINATTSFTGGGITGAIKSNEWNAAAEAYKAAGGKGNFEQVVKEAIDSGDSSYSYGAHYSTSTKQIETGTFPATDGLEGGYADKLGGLDFGKDDIDIHIGNENKSVKLSTETASDTISKAIEQLYANEGMTPSNGWIVLYKNVPYVFKNSKWYKIDEANGGLSWVHDKMVNSLNRFKTGGLADFTGPAWLDGTKSKPEIVLNQTDSANFIQLRDILADILNGTSNIPKTSTTEKGGDNYYDIEISVDSLGNDYDVEQLASKIKSMIYEDSTYRNVNSISGIR